MLIFHGWNIYGYSAGNIYGYSAAPCAKFCYAWIHICVQGTPGACVLICFEIDCSWKHSWIYVANSAAIYDNIAQPRIQNTFRMNPYVFKFLNICFQSFLSILFPKPFMQHILVLRINIVGGENVLFPNLIRMKTWIFSIACEKLEPTSRRLRQKRVPSCARTEAPARARATLYPRGVKMFSFFDLL